VSFIVGVSEDLVQARVLGGSSNDAGDASAAIGIGIDSSTVTSSTLVRSGGTGFGSTRYTDEAVYLGYVAAGKHTIAPLERGAATGTTTWYGDNGTTSTQYGLLAEVVQ
jgi:hypothetical protein